MLREFHIWITNNTGYNSVYHEKELSDSVVVDFENAKYIARFTAWEDLSCLSEILDADTGRYILNRRYECSSFNEILSSFKVFSKKLN